MAATVSNININFGANTAGLKTGVKEVQGVLTNLSSRLPGVSALSGAFSGMANSATSLSGALGGVAGGIGLIATASASLVGVSGWGLKLAAEAEQSRVMFGTLLGSIGQANTLLRELRSLAASTPLTFTGLRENSQTLLAFGMAGAEVLPTLRMLGDISGGNSERMQRLTLAFAQISAAGRLMGQDLLQLVNAGFNPLQEISKTTGKSMADLKKEMEEGKISFDMVNAAFKSATSEGGRFNNAMQNQAGTISQKWAAFSDKVRLLAEQFGTYLAPAAGIVIDMLSKLGDALGRYIAARGPIIEETLKRFAQLLSDLSNIVIKVIDGLAWYYQTWQDIYRFLGIIGPKTEQVFEELAATAVESASDFEKAYADAIASTMKEAERLMQVGENITKSLRTPDEIYADTISELKQLEALGAITAETFQRGMAKAAGDLDKTTQKQKDLLTEMRALNVGAVTRSSMAGFSAVIQGQNNNRQLQMLARQQLEEMQNLNRLTAEGNNLVREANRVRIVHL